MNEQSPQLIEVTAIFCFNQSLVNSCSEYIEWSWWDSNPRPHKETIRFLHVYSSLHFRVIARPGPPTMTLSSKAFTPGARHPSAISDLPAPLDP